MNYSGSSSKSSASRKLLRGASNESFGSRQGVTAVAELTGHYPVRIIEEEEFMRSLYLESPSLRMIESFRRISTIQDDTNRVELEIQKYSQDLETRNITSLEVLGMRMEKVQKMIDHLERLIRNKETLISRLRHQFVGDSLTIRLEDQRYVIEVIESIAPTLTRLPVILENIEKMSHLQTSSVQGRMNETLTEVLSVLDGLTQILDQILKLRSSMLRINSYHRPVPVST